MRFKEMFSKGKVVLMLAVAGLVGVSGVSPADGIAGIGKAAHVNIAVFHIKDGTEAPATISGKGELGLFKAMDGLGQVVTLTHTTGLKDGDIIQIASDVLRDGSEMEDFGVDCTFIVHIKNDEYVSIGGQCGVMIYDIIHNREIDNKLTIAPTEVGHSWTRIAWDGDDRIAVYVDEGVGTE